MLEKVGGLVLSHNTVVVSQFLSQNKANCSLVSIDKENLMGVLAGFLSTYIQTFLFTDICTCICSSH